MFKIYCDSLQEGQWFKSLNTRFQNASLAEIPSGRQKQQAEGLEDILKYDRPDIILKDEDQIIFVLERTAEVPSGHNVGQRFGRLVAAAEAHIPVVYFGPYKAYKHGGNTAGPRYMNLRLFYALHNVSSFYNTAVTTINWPIDNNCEVLHTPQKDVRIIEYLNVFFSYYDQNGLNGLTEFILTSRFQQEQLQEQQLFANTEIVNPEQYLSPPDSVKISSRESFIDQYQQAARFINAPQVVLYNVGMTYARSDPYAGMAALYHFLYCIDNSSNLVLSFPHITLNMWNLLGRNSKTYRMFKNFCSAIIFSDAIVEQNSL